MRFALLSIVLIIVLAGAMLGCSKTPPAVSTKPPVTSLQSQIDSNPHLSPEQKAQMKQQLQQAQTSSQAAPSTKP